jgi:hypothetical protein
MKREYDFRKAKRGRVSPAPPGKTRITIRIDNEILAWFRAQVHAAGGGNYQTLMNQALRDNMEHAVEPLEDTLRRVIREEMPAYRVRPGHQRGQGDSSTNLPATASPARSRRKK